MSCGCGDTTPFGGNDSYNNLCNTDTPYPIVSNESVPSLISNLTLALYGQIQKDISSGKVVWIIPCDPNNTAYIASLPREPGEGLMCYFIRYFNTVYPNGVLGIPYGGTGATNAPQALTNLGAVPITRQIITELSSGLAGGGDLTANRSLSIANTAVTPGTYGSQKKIPVIHVNARGQLTEVTEADAEGFAQVDSEVITASAQQTVFNLTTITYAPGTDNLAVYRNGLRLLLNLDYIETNSTTVTLTRGVAAGNQLLFESGRIIGQDISAIITRVENQTATAQQTVFTLTIATYVPGSNSLSVYRNGLKLVIGVDYAETNSNTVTLTSPSALGDQFEFDAGKILTQTLAGTSVDFLQAGTGAVTRNMQDKARESVSVLDFGAVGDGVTDDTAAIQAAIDSLGAVGGVVEVPPGTYKVSSALNISSYVCLRGSGAVASSIITNNSTGNVVYINGVSNSPGCTVENLFFNSSVTRTAGSYIESHSSNGTFVKNCKMYSAFNGISITGSVAQSIKIEDCQIDNTINYGINITAFNAASPNTTGIVASYISRVLITGAANPNNCNAGIRITSVGDLTLYGISTIYCKKGLDISPTGTNTVQALCVTDSFFDTGDEFGVALNPEATASVRLASFTNVWCSSNGMSGALLGGLGQIISTNWLNCTMAANTGQGLWITSTLAKNTSVIGGVYAQNSGSGFGIASDVSNFKIVGATIGRTDSNGYAFGPNGGFGINLVSGTSNKYIISNNIFTENTAGQISDGGSGVEKIVYPNIGIGTAITTNAVQSVDWGIDFAKQGAIAIESAGTYALAAGSGLVLLHSDTTGDIGVFTTWAGNVTKVSGAGSIVSGAAGSNQIGLTYNSGIGKYQISNGYATSQSIYIASLKTRLAS